jgi:hypothetical protein
MVEHVHDPVSDPQHTQKKGSSGKKNARPDKTWFYTDNLRILKLKIQFILSHFFALKQLSKAKMVIMHHL